MLEKYSYKVPRNKYKIIKRIKGTAMSKRPKDAYILVHNIMGLNAEALYTYTAESVTHKITKVANGYQATCSNIAVKMYDYKYYQKLLARADKEQNNLKRSSYL